MNLTLHMVIALSFIFLLGSCQPVPCCAIKPNSLPDKPDPSDYHSDTAAMAAQVDADYPLLRLKALKGDRLSLRRIFYLTKHAGFDGAAAELNALHLTELLHTTGDDHFGAQLQLEPADVRDEVQEMLLCDMGPERLDELRIRYTMTFSGYTDPD